LAVQFSWNSSTYSTFLVIIWQMNRWANWRTRKEPTTLRPSVPTVLKNGRTSWSSTLTAVKIPKTTTPSGKWQLSIIAASTA
jgi:hypothetical protein